MKSAKDYLKAEAETKLAKAKAISEKANDEGRNLTDEERAEVESVLSDVTSIKARVKELEDNERLQETIDGLSEVITNDEPTEDGRKTGGKSPGEIFVKSEAYQALKARGTQGRWTTGAVEIPDFALKAPGDIGTGETVSTIDSPQLGQPDVQPGIRGLTAMERRLVVADLLAPGTTDAAVIRYLEETVATSGAASVSEGGVKPASYLEFEARDEAVRKIATFLPVSDEMLEDEAGMASYLNGRLALFVRREEEDQLLNGDGSGTNLSGILDRAIGAAAAGDIGGTNAFDAIMAGITDVRVNAELEPDAFIVNPLDFAEMQIAKASTAGTYFSGGPYSPPAQNPWGLNAVVTPAIAQGSALVGAFREGAQVFRRGGLTVEASNSHADWFRRNLTAIRAEERLALAVYRPAAFSLVTLP